MKKHFFTLSLFVLFATPFVALGHTATATNTIGTDPSAVLEIRSRNQGFLPPRLTTQQRNAISAPATGTLIYNTNLQSLEIHVGANDWLKVGAPSSTLVEFFDANKDTGIHLEKDGNDDDTIRFFNVDQEHNSINASGTLHIKGILKDAAGNDGTAGQILSSTVTGTRWVDNEVTVFDADVNTGIHVDKNSSDGILHFDINGQEYMSINASGTLHIIGALKDALGSDGTAGQRLSSTGSKTAWVDLPTRDFKNNSEFIALNASTVSPRDHVVDTDLIELNIRSQDNDYWYNVHRGSSVIYHQGKFDTAPLEYRIIASSGTARIWLDRNIGASQRAISSSDTQAYGHYFSWTEINEGAIAGSGLGKICPTDFRLPTKIELEAEVNAGISNAATALSHLFLTLGGFSPTNIGSTAAGGGHIDGYGYFWSSDDGQYMYFSVSEVSLGLVHSKAYGFSVRCIKD